MCGSASKIELNKILILKKRMIRLVTFNDDGIISIPGPFNPPDQNFKYQNLYAHKFIGTRNVHGWIQQNQERHG